MLTLLGWDGGGGTGVVTSTLVFLIENLEMLIFALLFATLFPLDLSPSKSEALPSGELELVQQNSKRKKQ